MKNLEQEIEDDTLYRTSDEMFHWNKYNITGWLYKCYDVLKCFASKFVCLITFFILNQWDIQHFGRVGTPTILPLKWQEKRVLCLVFTTLLSNETLYYIIKNIMIWALFIQSPWSQLCDFCSQQEHFLESFLCKLDLVTNEVFLLIALIYLLEQEKEDENNHFYNSLQYKKEVLNFLKWA